MTEYDGDEVEVMVRALVGLCDDDDDGGGTDEYESAVVGRLYLFIYSLTYPVLATSDMMPAISM